MKRSFRAVLVCGAALVAAYMATGCAYMRNRGHDAMDIIDVGIDLPKSAKPQFGLYLNFFNVVPIGYASVDSKQIGMGNRQAGWLDHEQEFWGAVIWGKGKVGNGQFDPLDPHQVRPDQAGIAERQSYNAGIPRMIAEGNPPPPLQFMDCDKGFYLGYIGFHANCRPFDVIDFILGWTTLDIMGDDKPLTPVAQPAAGSGAAR